MTDIAAVLQSIQALSETDLDRWIAEGLVRPESSGEGWQFAEVDVARVRLIARLKVDMALDDAALPVVLALLDQVYGLRRQLRRLGTAVAAQPSAVQQAIAEHVKATLDATPE